MNEAEVLHVSRAEYLSTVSDLKSRGFAMCVDVTAVDYLTHPGRKLPEGITAERYEVVVGLLSLEERRRVRIRVQVPDEDPTIDTLFYLYPTSEALEREVYDLFGITFNNHPDMTRIVLPQEWEGHPLRKDYQVGAVPVQFKAVNGAE
ncbi:MAG: NADH-quinone oxidoreductase subunit C [Actinobacteria bacterium]|jgi:NADH-quinone oxidoreductase subunit C|nr:NADH-quinone oxidoreductase subunit C [Actinomycetota bacterium]